MDSLHFAWRELRRRKLRFLGTSFGYMLAVIILVTLFTVNQLYRKTANSVLAKAGTHFIAFGTCCTAEFGPGGKKADKNEGFVSGNVITNILPLSFVDEIKKFPSVKDAAPYLLFRFKHPQKGYFFTLGGFIPGSNLAIETNTSAQTRIISGRFLTPADKEMVLLEESFANSHMLDFQTGSRIKIAGKSFTIAGVINTGIRPTRADVYLPFEESRLLINEYLLKTGLRQPLTDETNIILVEAKDSRQQETAINAVRKLLPVVISSYGFYKPANQVQVLNDRIIWLLSIIIVIFSVVLSARTQFTSVVERRRDIGILKAIGWSDNDILKQIMLESLLQSLFGGIIGCLLAVILITALPLKTWMNIAPDIKIGIPPLLLVLALIPAIIGGLIAGIFSAFKAARHKPAEALRQF